jgi:hypothetical protein
MSVRDLFVIAFCLVALPLAAAPASAHGDPDPATPVADTAAPPADTDGTPAPAVNDG